MTYNELLDSIYEALPRLKGQLQVPTVVYVQ